MRPTVHDIAAQAGVSLATVDRVLNRRPGVKAATRLRVEAAIAAIGFVRDMAAANLAKSRVYPFTFILPGGDNSFMRGLERHVREAVVRPASDRVAISLVVVPPFDGAAVARALDAAIAQEPAGIAVVAVDAPDVMDAALRVQASGIPLVTLVSDLGPACRDHFAGIDNHAAGRTAGSLMRRFVGREASETAKVAVLAGSMLVRDHRDRLDGFKSALSGTCTLLPVLEGQDDPAATERLIADLLAQHSDLAGIYSLGAGNRGLIAALRRHLGPRPRAIIAHELTLHTRAALEADLIDAVLNQDAGHEVRSAIRVLKAKADGIPAVDAQERIRIDIFLKDNLPFADEADGNALRPFGLASGEN
ncbi:LacI family transcriptional regulator [Rhizobium sp. Leaf371]|uniref:LacI family DNA-binding transcriptional regulator n=1 Tax=Rhizobium sp. Leaf371 TaxID=1736355 RepID=UPI0007127E4E|nr:LacI family DNA-binding transcriptional regulator [Rhizobium sp. Leaf371]KQS64700.1 LacI family transcriptional regulator [Rhizobium sp. Leaf371]